MMRVIFLLSFLIPFISFGQVYQIMPQYGYEVKRMNFDSTLQIPTVCGVPTIKSVQFLKKAAIAFDSCNNRFYQYNPSTSAWSYLGSGGSTIDTTSLSNRINLKLNISDTTDKWVNSVTQLNDSTIRVQKSGVIYDYIIRSSVSASATRLVTTVYNNSGSTITKGSVVYINGRHSSNLPTIALAQANTEANSYSTFALVENDITNGNSGIVIQAGNITNLNLPTSSYTDGQIVYLSPTVAGGITTTKPLAPYHIVKIGTITRAHPTFGTIELKIENGWQLDEMSDVQIPAVPNDSTLLQFSRVDSLWHSVSVVNAIGTKYIKPSDTASMLTNYAKTSVVNAADNLKVNISDTSTMLSKYLRKTDTSTLSSRINLKVNISDTSAMLTNYVRKDTSCFYLISDVSTSNTTATNTNLTASVGTNETYRIMIAGTCSKATTTTGLKIAIAAPTGATLKGVLQTGGAALSTAMTNQLLSAPNTLNSNAFATGTGVEVPFRFEGVITTSSTSGSITLQFATVTSNAATIYAGTVMQLIKAKGL